MGTVLCFAVGLPTARTLTSLERQTLRIGCQCPDSRRCHVSALTPEDTAESSDGKVPAAEDAQPPRRSTATEADKVRRQQLLRRKAKLARGALMANRTR